jgi:hypothetical protein
LWHRTTNAAEFISEELASDDSLWRICAWHKNMNAMQVGRHPDATGLGVYEECHKGGAIIATAHSHSYARTKILTTIDPLRVGGVGSLFNSPFQHIGPGATFVFVSGLGGESIEKQHRCFQGLDACHQEWASIYTSKQGATYGALFITFHINGDPKKAKGYFKNIRGEIIDTFKMERN